MRVLATPMRLGLPVFALLLAGCSDYGLQHQGEVPELVDTDGDGIPDATGPLEGSPLRDTDRDGSVDAEDPDADGDGIPNDLDGDPDGDGAPGWSLPEDPADDPPVDVETGLPELQVGDARGRVCAPNETTWVAGATVRIDTAAGLYETQTNGDGWWQLPGLPPGDHVVDVTKGSFSMTFTITVAEGQVTEAVFDECLEQGDLRIAVVSGQYDAIGSVLDHLAIQYEVINGYSDNSTTAFLSDASRLAQYDMIFFNCGMSFDWVDAAESTVAANLQQFVNDGGSIYASDWAYYTVEAAFPDRNSFVGDDAILGDAFRGVDGTVQATVTDPAMAALLGSSTASLNYDLGGWVALDSTASDVDVLIEGDFAYYDDNDWEVGHHAALATRFSSGQGTVTYTSFHNETQSTLDMDLMLQDIVLSL